MKGMAVEIAASGDFNDLAQIHDSHAVADVLHNAQVM
jgi:hypothetical protein